jgi:TRAP-type C4-dicarboxylate transport system permease small subunit
MADRPVTERPLARLARTVEDGLLVALLLVMVFLAVSQIVLRNGFDAGLLWADPLLRLMVLWLGLLGAAVATRDDRQITVDVLSRLLSPRWRAGARVVTDLFTAGVCTVLGWNAGRLVLSDREAGVAAFASVPAWVGELVLPLAFTIIAWRYLRMAWRHLRTATGRAA